MHASGTGASVGGLVGAGVVVGGVPAIGPSAEAPPPPPPQALNRAGISTRVGIRKNFVGCFNGSPCKSATTLRVTSKRFDEVSGSCATVPVAMFLSYRQGSDALHRYVEKGA